MKSPTLYYILLVLPLSLLAQSPSDITPAAKRQETIELARTLLAVKPIVAEQDVTALNPLNPPPPVDGDTNASGTDSKVGLGASDRELLKRMAEGVTPSGMMQMGDKPVLLFGSKKFNVGDRLPVTFEGTTHELEIGAIERTNFTLRLRKEEITRPIKASSKKL